MVAKMGLMSLLVLFPAIALAGKKLPAPPPARTDAGQKTASEQTEEKIEERSGSKVAQPPPTGQPSWRVTTSLGTEIPLWLGVQASLEVPFRLQLSAYGGAMPELYVRTINGIVTRLAHFDAATETLINDSVEQGSVWGIRAGWRPLQNWGLFANVGLRRTDLVGTVSGQDAVLVFSGHDFSQLKGKLSDFDTSLSLFQADINVGYQWVAWEHFSFGTHLGFAAPIASEASFKYKGAFRIPALQAALIEFQNQCEKEAKSYMAQYGYVPIVGLNLGYLW